MPLGAQSPHPAAYHASEGDAPRGNDSARLIDTILARPPKEGLVLLSHRTVTPLQEQRYCNVTPRKAIFFFTVLYISPSSGCDRSLL